MKARTAIDKFDTLFRNDIPFAVKIDWLKALDHKIYVEIISTHEGAPDSYSGIDEDGDNDLFVEAPYDDIYVAYLRCKLDETNGETARYINSSQTFNDKLSAFAAQYNRTHMPKERAYLKFY